MFQKLNTPIWPNRALSLTPPLSLLLAAASVIIGIFLYVKGYTYEGATCIYMLSTVLFCWPYYSARYTGYMTWLVSVSFVPLGIWLQNKGVENGAWYYRPHDDYVIWITKAGEGWWGMTRHGWLGNDMPVMEYLFYPIFCFFQITLYSLFSHLLPDRWFEQTNRALKWTFPFFFILVFGVFVSLYFTCQRPPNTDYFYCLTGGAYVFAAVTYVASKSYRHYTATPAFWIWLVGMGMMFLPVWEMYHCGVNRDWVYDPKHNFPFLYSFRGAGFPVGQPFSYITTALTFKALMMFLILKFGHIVVRNRRLLPFVPRHPPHS